MREPGEDYDGEYFEIPPAARPVSPALTEDLCSCPKAVGHYGRRGWHWTPEAAAYERCPRYQAAVSRNAKGAAGGRAKR